MLTLPCPLGERTQAFTGLLAVVGRNPALLLGHKSHIYSFVTACCTAWCEEEDEERPPHVMAGIRDVLVAVRGNNTQLWERVMSKFEPEQISTLVQLFQL